MTATAFFNRRTKIVCTIGPASGSALMLERLMRAGMNVARLNLSHGTLDAHAGYVKNIRKIGQRLDKHVAILMDLPGPKYRTGRLEGGEAVLKKGATVTLTTRDVAGNASLVPVNLPGLDCCVKKDDTVLLDDGVMELRVLAIDSDEIKCRVISGGVLTERRGLVVPGMLIPGPFMTDKLREQISFAIEQSPDYLALSFVSKAEDIEDVRQFIQEKGADIPIITKIERAQAVREFYSILAASDGIMVARGDLGVDMPLEKVPLVQKEIISKCNRAGKPVITATQMLESMVNAPRPTRAEVADVANAIFDGTDATMLSAETSIGKYAVDSVKTMAKIALEIESRLPTADALAEKESWILRQTDELISYSACHVAQSLGATAIVAFTQSGSTARRVSKYRPGIPILAITASDVVSGRLLLHWGVYPFNVKNAVSVDDMFSIAANLACGSGVARNGDRIVITGGVPVGTEGATNLLKVETIV